MIELKREIDKPIIIAEDLNTPVSKTVKTKGGAKEIAQWITAWTEEDLHSTTSAYMRLLTTHCSSSSSRESDASGL